MSRRLVALHLQRVLLDQIVDALVDEHRIIQRHHLGLPGSVEPYPGHDTLGKRECRIGNCDRRNSAGTRAVSSVTVPYSPLPLPQCVMAGIRLDGAGQAKMVALDDSVLIHQRIHNLVEQYALQVKRNQPAGHLLMNLKRQMPMLAGKLKGHFGMISDLVTATKMSMTRGSTDAMRVRAMREGVASIKVQLEIAVAQTIAKHKAEDEKH